MLKNILVHIPSERAARPVIEGAISIATSRNAQLDALSIGYELTSVAFVADGAAAMAAVYDIERERAMERANSAMAEFNTAAAKAGISYSCRALTASPNEAWTIAGGAARLHDLTIVLQPDPESASNDNAMAQEILFQSGGPVLVLPYTHKGPCTPKRIGIAWDGSRAAARALRDATPFLKEADTITIISANDDEAASEVNAEAAKTCLARHGLTAVVERLTAGHADIQPMLLSTAADLSLDLLVMGGYGHSRLQEGLLGGVTRAMFQSMTVPTLMSH
ncbi:universal stress protein [Bradyrhizobium sp. dw_78]|uniref:universal stress protein n=1 Tax=Bradyrhizobium sp. dw_78 TaxID=2719793 RepID=UPI001BD1D99C|nr:universal stress protein [Bradyrhizobium sp. dw_78]